MIFNAHIDPEHYSAIGHILTKARRKTYQNNGDVEEFKLRAGDGVRNYLGIGKRKTTRHKVKNHPKGLCLDDGKLILPLIDLSHQGLVSEMRLHTARVETRNRNLYVVFAGTTKIHSVMYYTEVSVFICRMSHLYGFYLSSNHLRKRTLLPFNFGV